jgi:hypothetical protein
MCLEEFLIYRNTSNKRVPVAVSEVALIRNPRGLLMRGDLLSGYFQDLRALNGCPAD